jgi:protein-S-isoprenylcysteine O-methyltransferase Ste14
MTNTDRPISLTRPRSVNTGWVNFLGLGGFLSAVMLLARFDLSRPVFALLSMLATAGPMIAVDLIVRKVHRRPSTGLAWDETDRPGFDIQQVAVKLLGLAGSLAPLVIVYAVIPEYRRGFYDPFWQGLELAAPWVLPLAVAYFAFVDARMIRPRDGYWIVGSMLLGRRRWRNLDAEARHELIHHALGWVIKGFFLPLMFVFLGQVLASLSHWNLDTIFNTMPRFAAFVITLSLAIDLAFVTIGYCLTLRLIDAHIRTGNPFMYGWVFTLVVYPPFWGWIDLKYSDGANWSAWLNGMPVVLWFWGLFIVISCLGWAWANLSFGCRFSNLTHRGIITNGPYRWSKHPSYIFKNLSWWLISMPFLSSGGVLVAFQTSLILLGINTLYFIRARAEERHLSEDPVYVAYAQWINKHGTLAWLGRRVLFFKYRPSPGAGNRSHDQTLGD